MIKNIYTSIDWLKKCFFRKNVFFSFVLLWIIIQVVIAAFYWDPEWVSDPGLYQYYAVQSVENSSLYPSFDNYYDEFIFAPGWVNLLALIYYLFGSFTMVPYILIVINAINLIVLLKISDNITGNNRSIHYLLGYLYIALLANTTTHIFLYSEYIYVFFANSALYLALKNKLVDFLLCGILISLAIWTRPLAYAWFLAIIFLSVICYKNLKGALVFMLMVMISAGTIGFFTHLNFPDFLFQAKSGGVNMIMGADDSATGGYNPIPRLKGGAAYIPELYDQNSHIPVKNYSGGYALAPGSKWSYSQVDSIYMSKSKEYIINHPLKWLSLMPSKLNILCFSGSMSNAPSFDNILAKKICSLFLLIQLFIVRLVFLFCFIGLFTGFWKNLSEIYLLIPIFVAVTMTLVCVSATRYNYIFLHLAMLFALITLRKIYLKFKFN